MYVLMKRIFDVLVSSIALILCAPSFLLIAIIIKIESRGPIFFRQISIGKDGRQFSRIKFRTMVIITDENAHRIYLRKLLTGDFGLEKGNLFKLENDPRITKIGIFLRRTALDQLPQLINVVKGDMSLIGPHPALPFELQYYKEWYKERLKCKPGLTGLWQVYGRPYVSLEQPYASLIEQMIKMDIEYSKRQSILLDFRILVRTFILSLRGERAI